jgi:hypothetical protein
MWSLLEFFPEYFQINVLDVGAALMERLPYQSLVMPVVAGSSASNLTKKLAND